MYGVNQKEKKCASTINKIHELFNETDFGITSVLYLTMQCLDQLPTLYKVQLSLRYRKLFINTTFTSDFQ